ncbi:trihelix transcription factor ENAP1-like [Nymphaea colorata]|nr:trihelix transcription factor ENAP1-like [Nymphaea colorata]
MEEEGNAHHGGYPPHAFLQSTQTELVNGEMAVASSSKNPERSSSSSKRDEWSEGGVMSLLDVYESKWLLRNRAKLKGSDWEEIARQVSARSCGAKPSKTPNQCKNKIESMKKRYRAESSGVQAGGLAASSWQFYSRMDNLLRGLSCPQSRFLAGNCFDGVVEPALTDLGLQELPKVELDESDDHLKQMLPIKMQDHTRAPGAIAEEGVVGLQVSDRDDGSNTLVPNHQKEGESDTSTPKSKVANDDCGSGEGLSFKRRRGSSDDVAASIRMLADSLLKIEMARMEMYRDTERMRLEAEVKRGEMELKRTEIIAETQLQIAKLLSKRKRGQKKKNACPFSSKPEALRLDGSEMKGD